MPDRTLEILLKIRSDVADLQKVVGGIKDVRTVSDEAAKSGFGLKQAFEFAGANEVLHRLVETLKEVPRQFVECIKQGVEFNAELQRVQTSIAGIFRQQAPDKFPTFEKAKEAAAETIDLLKAKANELGVAYTDMFETYQHAQALLSAGGISNVRQQIDVIALLNRAMQSLGVNATSAARDISDLLQGGGKAAQTLGVPRLASLVHMTTEEFLQWIETSKQAGTLAEDLQSKFGGLASGMAATGQTFDAQTTRMQNAIFDLKQAAAEPIMEPLTEAIRSLSELLKDEDTKSFARTIGDLMKEIAVDTMIALAGWKAIGLGWKDAKEDLANIADKLIGIASVYLNIPRGVLPGREPAGGSITPGLQLGGREGAESERFDLREFLESGLNKQREKGNTLEVGKSKILGDQTAQLELQQQIEDQLNLSRAQASGDTEAVAQERATIAADKTVAAMKTKHVTQLEINGELLNEDKVWRAIYDATYNQINALAAGKQSHEDITSLLREQETVLQNIRQQENLIAQNPFLSADAKDAQLANLYLKEQAILLIEIEKVRAKIKEIRGLGDPAEQAEVAELNQKLQSLEFTLSSISQKFQTTGFMGGLQKELADWVNNFGTSAHQIAGLIEGSINVSLQAMNDLIINGQGNVVDLEKKLLGMFLTMLEQMALQQAASLLGITTTTSAQVAAGGAIAAAHAPAAAATSISSYGAAALIGEVAAIAAIIAIMAALGGGFKRGGFTGTGHEDQIAGPAHKGEFYFSKRETESIGLSNLYALKHSAPRFGSGGRLNPDDVRDAGLSNMFWSSDFPVSSGRFFPNAGLYGGPATLPGHPGPPDAPVTGGGVTGPTVDIMRPVPGAGSVPYWNQPARGGYAPTPNYPGQFGGNMGLGFFSPWSGLGFGTRPAVGPQVSLAGVGLQPNTSRGTWEIYNPGTGVFETVGHFGESAATVQARAAAVIAGSGASPSSILNPPSSFPRGGLGSLSQTDRFARGSGTGNWMADQFTKQWELSQDPGGPNFMGTTTDAGHTIFYPGGGLRGYFDPELGVVVPIGAAGGTRIAGPASRADNILAWLSTGERVVPADRNILLERKFGFDWDKRLELAMPRLASGGVVAGRPTSDLRPPTSESDVHVYIFDDRRKAQRAYEESPHARKVFRDRLNRYS